jgi:hypothetical protein
MFENYVLPQLNNNNIVLKMACVSVNFADIFRVCLIMNFRVQWVGRKPKAWLLHSSDLTPLGFFLWGFVKDQAYKQRVSTLDEFKAQSTAATVKVTKDMLQCHRQDTLQCHRQEM